MSTQGRYRSNANQVKSPELKAMDHTKKISIKHSDNDHAVSLICTPIENGLSLERVLGDSPVLKLPDETSHGPILEIAPYCFSDSKNKELSSSHSQDSKNPDTGNADEKALSGLALRELYLPDSVTTLGAYAFYNCKNLELIKAGPSLTHIHSDVFMNCTGLKTLIIDGGPEAESGLKNLLSRANNTIEVCFKRGDDELCRIIYPEYTMRYETVYAAHIFQMRVNGAGYGPRQAFRGGIIDFPAYDKAIENAFPVEDIETLLLISAYRILWPLALSDEYRGIYEAYLSKHNRELGTLLIKRENAKAFSLFRKAGILSPAGVKAALDYARTNGKTRLLMEIMKG